MHLPTWRLERKPLFQAIALIRIVARIWFLWALDGLYLEEKCGSAFWLTEIPPQRKRWPYSLSSDGRFMSGAASVEWMLCAFVT